MRKGINLGSRNNQWKGDKVSYGALHDYIKWHLPKTKLCQSCGLKPPYDCANISGEYKRDLSDWEWLCRKCHMVKDGRLDNIHKQRIFDRNKVCLLCKNEFIVRYYDKKFCSLICSNKSRSKNAKMC